MKFILQKKLLILSILFFLFSCSIFLFLYKVINDNKEISQSTQEKLQTEISRRDSIKALINSVQTISKERAQLDTHFVRSSDVVPFLDTIEKLAKEAGTNAEVTSVGLAADKASLEVEMKAQGDFENIYKLIMLLENSPYNLEFILVSIQNLNTEIVVEKDTKIERWTANFKISLKSFINQ
jgi:hypothetical protein